MPVTGGELARLRMSDVKVRSNFSSGPYIAQGWTAKAPCFRPLWLQGVRQEEMVFRRIISGGTRIDARRGQVARASVNGSTSRAGSCLALGLFLVLIGV